MSHQLFLAYAAVSNLLTAEETKQVVKFVEAKGLFGLFWQLRNREAHAFELLSTFGATGNLSLEYVNYWRIRFPLLVTAAYLICINLDLHKEESFKEFFKGPEHFYDRFKNKACAGHDLI